jgi:predicted RNA-binding Zn ribbon-like protein
MAKYGDPSSSDWKDGFLFVGNQLALDLLNTRPIQNGEPQEFLGDFKALLRWFRAADLVSSREFASLQQWDGSSLAQRILEEIRGLREDLRKEILRWEAGGKLHHATIEKLNGLLAMHPMLSKMVESDAETRADQYFEARQPEDLFAPLAYGAAKLFAEAERTRVRKCGNCVLHFLDTSKKGTRRWCSMQLCGNRLKVAAYARRQRKGEPHHG